MKQPEKAEVHGCNYSLGNRVMCHLSLEGDRLAVPNHWCASFANEWLQKGKVPLLPARLKAVSLEDLCCWNVELRLTEGSGGNRASPLTSSWRVISDLFLTAPKYTGGELLPQFLFSFICQVWYKSYRVWTCWVHRKKVCSVTTANITLHEDTHCFWLILLSISKHWTWNSTLLFSPSLCISSASCGFNTHSPSFCSVLDRLT